MMEVDWQGKQKERGWEWKCSRYPEQSLTPRAAPGAFPLSDAPGIHTTEWGRARLSCLGSIEEVKASIKSQSALGKQRKRLLRINFSLPKLYGEFWKCQVSSIFSEREAQRWFQTPLFGLSGNLYPNISIKNFCWLICLGFSSGERDGGLGGFAYFQISVILILHKLLQGWTGRGKLKNPLQGEHPALAEGWIHPYSPSPVRHLNISGSPRHFFLAAGHWWNSIPGGISKLCKAG